MMMVQGTERVCVTPCLYPSLDCFLEARIASNARRVMASILKSSDLLSCYFNALCCRLDERSDSLWLRHIHGVATFDLDHG